ncbi:retrotransposon protein, putative, ty1-copia subclass [Tanacetum coccineum]
MVPTKKVEKTPYEIWHGQAPKLSYLRVWGCEAFVKHDTLTKPDKLDPRSFKSIFIGYPKETMGYSFYSPSENKYTSLKLCLDRQRGLFTQTYGVDYEETFSPVADIRAIRILIAIAAYYDYEIWQNVMSKAFLNGHLVKTSYMEQLRQASRQWNKRFDDEIKKFGFAQNPDEPCVYLKASGSYVAILILYVDDILLMGNNFQCQDVKSYLGRSALIDENLEKILYGKIPSVERSNARKPISQNRGEEHGCSFKIFISILRNTKEMFSGNMESADWICVRSKWRMMLIGKVTKTKYFLHTSSTNAEYIDAFDASKETHRKDDRSHYGCKTFGQTIHYLREDH